MTRIDIEALLFRAQVSGKLLLHFHSDSTNHAQLHHTRIQCFCLRLPAAQSVAMTKNLSRHKAHHAASRLYCSPIATSPITSSSVSASLWCAGSDAHIQICRDTNKKEPSSEAKNAHNVHSLGHIEHAHHSLASSVSASLVCWQHISPK